MTIKFPATRFTYQFEIVLHALALGFVIDEARGGYWLYLPRSRSIVRP